MKAYLLEKSGKPDVLKIHNLPEPEPSDGQVRVALSHIGINYAEILSRKGLYEWAPKRPYTPGMEGSGTITAVGEGVDAKRIGQKVVIGTQHGCYAESVVVPAERTIPVVESYSMAENAAFPVNYMTAWVSLFEMARVRPGETVLVTAAAGGVGTAAIQLASRFGCRVIGLAGNDEKIAWIESLGADKGFNYRDPDYFSKIKAYTKGVDMVVEMVGGQIYRNNIKLLNPLGRMVLCGFASLDLKKWNPVSWWKTWRDIPRVNIMNMAVHSYGLLATHLGYLLKDPQRTMAVYSALTQFVNEHNIRPQIGRTFSFSEIPEAHRFIESRKSTGKVLIQVKDS